MLHAPLRRGLTWVLGTNDRLSLYDKLDPDMIAKTIAVLAMIAVAAALVMALVKGRIELNAAGSGLVANRATEPGSFWTVFCIGLGVIICLGWLVLGA